MLILVLELVKSWKESLKIHSLYSSSYSPRLCKWIHLQICWTLQSGM